MKFKDKTTMSNRIIEINYFKKFKLFYNRTVICMGEREGGMESKVNPLGD